MRPTFDRNREHAVVHGDGHIRYYQDGHFFTDTGAWHSGEDARVICEPVMATVSDEVMPKAEGDLPVDPIQSSDACIVGGQPPTANLPAGEQPQTDLPREDMRLKENKAVKLQWENFHGDEPFPGVARAKQLLGMEE